MEELYPVTNMIRYNFENIVNFFITRNTNANAESINSKIKLFRAIQRGVLIINSSHSDLHKLLP
jgi:transposase